MHTIRLPRHNPITSVIIFTTICRFRDINQRSTGKNLPFSQDTTAEIQTFSGYPLLTAAARSHSLSHVTEVMNTKSINQMSGEETGKGKSAGGLAAEEKFHTINFGKMSYRSESL